MIPKIINYCWFGKNEKPDLAQRCIASWKKYCPDYEIIEWNEDNFDVQINDYTKMCYELKKWAFLSDYARLLIVYQNGGLYFDTDVELLRRPDFLLDNLAFFGFETDGSGSCDATSNTGLGFGSVAGGIALKKMIEEYEPLLDGQHGVFMCPDLNTHALEEIGLIPNGQFQEYEWGKVYPREYFNPYESTTGVMNRTNNTVSIHWYMGSCLTKKQVIRAKLTRPFHRLFGKDCFAWMRKM